MAYCKYCEKTSTVPMACTMSKSQRIGESLAPIDATGRSADCDECRTTAYAVQERRPG